MIAFSAYEFLDGAQEYEVPDGVQDPAGSAAGKEVWNGEGRNYIRSKMPGATGSMAKFRGTYRKLRGR